MHKYFYLTKNHYSDYIKALLLTEKDKDSQANRRVEERARDTRQDTQMADKHMQRGSTFPQSSEKRKST